VIAAALIMMAAAKPAAVLPKCASTSVCPGVLVDGTPYHRAVKPGTVVLGFSRPSLTGLKWRVYDHAEAVATGTVNSIATSCPPPYYRCPPVTRPVTVTFRHAVRGAAGNWFYSRMHIAGNLAGIGVGSNWGVTSRGFWDSP
jgi:hypothetical protein